MFASSIKDNTRILKIHGYGLGNTSIQVQVPFLINIENSKLFSRRCRCRDERMVLRLYEYEKDVPHDILLNKLVPINHRVRRCTSYLVGLEVTSSPYLKVLRDIFHFHFSICNTTINSRNQFTCCTLGIHLSNAIEKLKHHNIPK